MSRVSRRRSRSSIDRSRAGRRRRARPALTPPRPVGPHRDRERPHRGIGPRPHRHRPAGPARHRPDADHLRPGDLAVRRLRGLGVEPLRRREAERGAQDLRAGDRQRRQPAGRRPVRAAGFGRRRRSRPAPASPTSTCRAWASDYHFTIVEGTNDADLEKGPGHYVGTALPGQVGNFAVAGHRVGKGEPFLNLDQLQPGDAVVIETVTNWYVYTVLGDADDRQPGHAGHRGGRRPRDRQAVRRQRDPAGARSSRE